SSPISCTCGSTRASISSRGRSRVAVANTFAGVYSPFLARDPADAPRSAPRSRLSPINQRRLENFRRNRRGFWSLWIFLVLFVLTLGSEFIANDRPLLASYN